MLGWLEQFLIRYPELALFLVIGAGYWIGSFKVGAFSLGPVTGALFAGLLVGQFAHVPVSGMTKSFLFLLFLFGIGYSVGPQFMQALKRDGLKPVLLAVVVCITGLLASIVSPRCWAWIQALRQGLCPARSPRVPRWERRRMRSTRLPFAGGGPRTVCCAHRRGGCGHLHLRLRWRHSLLTVIAPALLQIDLKEEASKLEETLGMTRGKGSLASAWRKFELRAYRLPEGAPLVAATVAAAEAARRRAPAVHPQDSPGGSYRRSGAGSGAPSRRRDRDLRPAAGHRRPGRIARGRDRGQGTPRRPGLGR